MSKDQIERKYARMLAVAKYFVEHSCSMDEIESATGISSSSAQRYLHDKELAVLIGQEAFDLIQDMIAKNKQAALVAGGQNFAQNNLPTKDEVGKFTGSTKK